MKLPAVKYVSPGDVMYNMMTIVKRSIMYLADAKRVDLKSLYHKKKVCNYVW